MALHYTITQTVDLHGAGRTVVFPDALLTPGDAEAHQVEITVLDGGHTASLTGYTASGYFERAGGSIIAVSGTISGNVIRVHFSRACYAFPGRLRLLVRLARGDGTVVTLANDLFQVGDGIGNEVISEDETLSSLPELLNEIERLEAANAAAESIVLVQDEQPTEEGNRIWIRTSGEYYELPLMSDITPIDRELDRTLRDTCGQITDAMELAWESGSFSATTGGQSPTPPTFVHRDSYRPGVVLR